MAARTVAVMAAVMDDNDEAIEGVADCVGGRT